MWTRLRTILGRQQSTRFARGQPGGRCSESRCQDTNGSRESEDEPGAQFGAARIREQATSYVRSTPTRNADELHRGVRNEVVGFTYPFRARSTRASAVSGEGDRISGEATSTHPRRPSARATSPMQGEVNDCTGPPRE